MDQQKNKIKHLKWDGLDKKIGFVYANEIEPKPSPAGIIYILKSTGAAKDNAIMIGDSEIDLNCASNGGIKFINISDLVLKLDR